MVLNYNVDREVDVEENCVTNSEILDVVVTPMDCVRNDVVDVRLSVRMAYEVATNVVDGIVVVMVRNV